VRDKDRCERHDENNMKRKRGDDVLYTAQTIELTVWVIRIISNIRSSKASEPVPLHGGGFKIDE